MKDVINEIISSILLDSKLWGVYKGKPHPVSLPNSRECPESMGTFNSSPTVLVSYGNRVGRMDASQVAGDIALKYDSHD